MGLLDLFSGGGDDPQSQAQMAAAMALLQAGGPSLRPTSFGQALGGAMQASTAAAQAYKDRLAAEALRKAQLEHQALIAENLGLDIGTKKRANAQADAERQAAIDYYQARQPTAAAQAQPAQAVQQPLSVNFDAQGQGGFQSTPSLQGAAPQAQIPMQQPMQGDKGSAIQSRIDDLNNRATFMESKGLVASADAYRKQALELEKSKPKFASEPRVVMGPDGKPMLVQMADDGTVRPIMGGFGVAEKVNMQNIGGQTLAIDPYTGKPVNAIRNTQSPDNAATVAATMRGQNLSDARARELNAITREGQQTQVINDPIRGPMLIDKGRGTAKIAVDASGQPIQGEVTAKREFGANALVPILADARMQIGKATGSYLGTGMDKAAQAFGYGTGGAQAISRLKVLEGQIMMSQPRMEGPQSDKDVAMYRQMAGQIGDPTVPQNLKLSALDEIEKLNSKYATNKGSQGQSSSASFDSMPPANSSNRGKTLRDSVTGKTYVSTGLQWKEQ